MKANFKCPKCQNWIKVSKHLHADYTCNICNHKMVLNRQDLMRKTTEYRDPYAFPTPVYNKWKKEHKNNFNRYKKHDKEQVYKTQA